jgi:ABC-type lipoprotein export system ATPase subunit
MIKLSNISKYYHTDNMASLGLRKINIEFNLGEFIVVTGESGSGKSTLLNIISGLDTYEEGEIYINNVETSYYSIKEWEVFRKKNIGFVFQSYNIIDSYTVLENVMIALIIQGYDKNKRKERALELIKKVGLTSHIHHIASRLSGGQKQRCVIARAIAKDCPIIIADEPTGNLDSESGKIIMKLLKEISKEKLVIVVTHNYDQVKEYATRKITLFDGEVKEDIIIKRITPVIKKPVVSRNSMNILNLAGIAIRDLLRTPRRTIFTLFVSMFAVIIFVFAYGNFSSEPVETINPEPGIRDTFLVGGGFFLNVIDSRIIVTKFDGTPFTQTEIEEISNINLVRTVVDYDIILDLTIYSFYNELNWIFTNDNFVNPADMLKTNELIEGSLPSNIHEVVIEETEGYDIGDTIILSFSYPDYTTETPVIQNGIEFTISGIAETAIIGDYHGRMYFHEDFINSDEVIFKAFTKGGGFSTPLSFKIDYNGSTIFNIYEGGIYIDENILDNEMYVSDMILPEFLSSSGLNPEGNVSLFNGLTFQLFGTTTFDTIQSDIIITDSYELSEGNWSYISMNTNTLTELITDDIYQISVMVHDEYDAKKVINEIDELGYNSIYPAGVDDEEDKVAALLFSLYLGLILGILLIVIYFISYIVLKNVQDSKKRDYVIFRSIGASKIELNIITIIELLLTTITAYIISMGLFVLNEQINIKIPQYMKYFTIKSHITIFLLMIVLAVALGVGLNKRIFNTSVISALKVEQV